MRFGSPLQPGVSSCRRRLRVQGGSLPFDGQLDDIRIYGRALSTVEISTLADGGAEEKLPR